MTPSQAGKPHDLIDAAAVPRTAALARLRLTDAEARAITVELQALIARMEALPRLPLQYRGASTQGSESTPLRADRPGSDPLLRPPSGLAPEWAEPFFSVPRSLPHRPPGTG